MDEKLLPYQESIFKKFAYYIPIPTIPILFVLSAVFLFLYTTSGGGGGASKEGDTSSGRDSKYLNMCYANMILIPMLFAKIYFVKETKLRIAGYVCLLIYSIANVYYSIVDPYILLSYQTIFLVFLLFFMILKKVGSYHLEK